MTQGLEEPDEHTAVPIALGRLQKATFPSRIKDGHKRGPPLELDVIRPLLRARPSLTKSTRMLATHYALVTYVN